MRRARSRTVMAAEPSYYEEGIKEGEEGGAAKRGIWLMILQDLGREEGERKRILGDACLATEHRSLPEHTSTLRNTFFRFFEYAFASNIFEK